MTEETQYDVFLSYNSQDKSAVERMAQSLRNRSLEPFLDRWYLRPGLSWPQKLEEALRTCRAVAVFLGPYGLGGWQAREMYLALERQKQEPLFPVIPILLPNADPALSFLTLNTWVDLRGGIDDPVGLEILTKAIRGEPPGPELQERITAALATVCPYRGLRAFREEDAPFFFGRGAFADQLAGMVKQRSLVAVVGASGSGKSSVVFAGLVPRLRRARPPEAVWDVASFTSSDRPFHQLAVALVSLLEPEVSPFERRKEANRWAEGIQKGEVSLRDLVEEVLAKQPGTDRLLLVADQFEELYTLTLDESVRHGFVDHLLEATAHFPIQVVLTLRGDFYGRALSHRPFADALQDGVVNLGPMIRGELERTVVEPARKVGLEFERGLVERILEDMGDDPGNLPLLEFALTELWNRRRGGMLTHEAYKDIGQVQGAIARRAEAEYGRLGDEEKRLARRIFLRLVAPGEGTEDTRRRAALAELLPTEGEAMDIETVVWELAGARLLTTGRDERGKEIVNVVHEALIRGWPRLRRWIDEDRDALRTHRRLTEAATEWEENNRDGSYLYHGAHLAEAEEWAEEHADDLNSLEREFLDSSVSAHKRTQTQRVAVGLAAILLVIGALALFAIIQNRTAIRERNITATAQAERDRAEIALARQLTAQALNQIEEQLDLALLLSLEANYLSDVVEVRGNLLDGLQYNPCLTTFLRGHTDKVRSVAFSPDGQTLASASWDNTIILWDVTTGQPIGQPLTDHRDMVQSVAFSPDGKMLASASKDNTIILWDVATGQPLGQPLTGHTTWVFSVAFSPDGQTLASGEEDGTIILWDIATRQPLDPPLTGHTAPVYSVAFSPDGQTLASGSEADGTIILWDAATGQSLDPPLTAHTDVVKRAVFNPDGKLLASGSVDKTIILWDVIARQPIGPPLTGHTAPVYDVAFSPDGKTLVSGSTDGTIIQWDIASGQPTGPPLTDHAAAIYSVAFNPDGQTLTSGSEDGVIILWDVAAHPRLGQPLTGHTEGVRSVAFSPDGQTLASGSDDGTIILWDVAAGQRLGHPLTDHADAVVSVALSPDGKTLASSSYGIIILWDVVSRQPLGQPLTGHTDWVRSVAFSPDGKMLASGGWDNTVILWDVATRQPISQPLTNHTDAVVSVAFSPDSKTLASGSKDNSITLWDVTTRQPLGQPLTDHTDWVLSVAFSPDGRTLASGSADHTIILWDVATGCAIGQPLTSHTDKVLSVAFSPDGRTLASGSTDNTIILWDVTTRQLIGQPLNGHTDWVSSIAFSPDGKTLASSSKDNTITLWDVSFDAWRDHACRIANRNLKQSEWDQFIGPDIPYERTCPDLPPGESAPPDAPAATY